MEDFPTQPTTSDLYTKLRELGVTDHMYDNDEPTGIEALTRMLSDLASNPDLQTEIAVIQNLIEKLDTNEERRESLLGALIPTQD
jgi:hypothetical protein